MLAPSTTESTWRQDAARRIYAAHAGTVAYAGAYGGYGNYIRINHGGGISTGYGHIVNGGILVGSGQQVEAGQVIAASGQHRQLHRLPPALRGATINGTATNPVRSWPRGVSHWARAPSPDGRWAADGR